MIFNCATIIDMELKFSAPLQRWIGENGWFYVVLPEDSWEMLRSMSGISSRGFGSIKVSVQVGRSEWKTSIFPDTKMKRYILFIKIEIRNSENVTIDDVLELTITI